MCSINPSASTTRNAAGSLANGELPARFSKFCKAQRVPLHSTGVERLRDWFGPKANLTQEVALSPLKTRLGYSSKTSKMMRFDLMRAGISYRDEESLFANFHTNRPSFMSNISWIGIPALTDRWLAR